MTIEEAEYYWHQSTTISRLFKYHRVSWLMCKAAQLSYETVSLCGGCTVAPGGLGQAQTVSYLKDFMVILVLGYDDSFMPLY